MARGRLRKAFAAVAFAVVMAASGISDAQDRRDDIYGKKRTQNDIKIEIALVAVSFACGLAGAVWLGCKIHDDISRGGSGNSWADRYSRDRFSQRR